jgi:hypothetical protein
MRGGWRIVLLSRCHRVHQIGGVDGLVLVLLRVEKSWVQRIVSQEGWVDGLVLGEIVAGEEAIKVGTAVVGEIEGIGVEVAALRPKVRRIVLRQVLRGLKVILVGKGRLLLVGLALGGREELRVVVVGARYLEAGGGVVDGKRGVEAETRDVVLERRVWRGRRRVPYIARVLTRRRGAPTRLVVHDCAKVVLLLWE